MSREQTIAHARIFISYCHIDREYRAALEKRLIPLERDGSTLHWSDREILPGGNLDAEIKQNMDKSNVFVFLMSDDFIASEACMHEFQYATELEGNGNDVCRIPVIIRECAWLDTPASNIKALPDDGKAISTFGNRDTGWRQVYEGIKAVTTQIAHSREPRREFVETIEKTDFISESHIRLGDIFTFLRMTRQEPQFGEQISQNEIVSDVEELLAVNQALIFGPQNSGKTALAKHLFLTLAGQQKDVLFINCDALSNRPYDAIIRAAYEEQFSGSYERWHRREQKTIIIDNLTSDHRRMEFVVEATKNFARTIITTSTESYVSFFRDEERLSEFTPLKIEPLNQVQQERLIRKRLELSERRITITDEYVDYIEREVNEIIISDRIFPRYPFYVLSIMQSYEAYMPSSMSITSYGHCYHALIVANLIKSGINNADGDIGAAFNLAENLAYARYEKQQESPRSDFNFDAFIEKYKNEFAIANAMVNRLKEPTYGLINQLGEFRTDYMQYYFLGKFLAQKKGDTRQIIDRMCEHSHRESNYLTLLFVIHHSDDDTIIEDILLRTMHSLVDTPPAKLTKSETKQFASIMSEIPTSILREEGVPANRERDRSTRDRLNAASRKDPQKGKVLEYDDDTNNIYRIMKNNRIMAQVLRNKHGRLRKLLIKDIVETVAESGLRMVNLIIKDEEFVTRMTKFLKEKHSERDIEKIGRDLEWLCFIWAMMNIEDIVHAVNVKEIRDTVTAVVQSGNTPAYDLIGYFSQLDTAIDGMTEKEKSALDQLLKKHDDAFIKRVLSIRTQHHLNTHYCPSETAQSICNLLGIQYKHRPALNQIQGKRRRRPRNNRRRNKKR